MAGHSSSSASGSAPEEPTGLTSSSWRGVLKRSVTEFKNDNLSDWAAALTYRSVLTLAPAMLLLVSIVGFLGSSAVQKLRDNINALTPGGIHSTLQQILDSVQHRQGAGLAAVLGLVVAWWSASSYVAAFMRASNAIYEVGEGRPVWKTIPLRMLITLAMLVLGVLAAAIVIFSGPLADRVGHALGLGSGALMVWNIAKWPVLFIIVSLMLAILYYAAPNARQPGVQWISPGGVLAVVIWLVASAGFAVYVANFGSYNKTYGTLAGVIIFLVWMWLTNMAILLGAEFNAELQHARAIQDGRAAPDSDGFAVPRDTTKLSREKTQAAQALSQDR
ncbi:YihY/virulence factor BrkB family protein [Jatrophihabitans telluris]|uniref:YihY/virulence factor BrkB family protein n=1 Tax=Jatrophihabitans telluris TaxID=2038343 RepID=A0ABY4R0E6_9ACTN|nr:YihY/virulence factor BrkB family protein [Jatrophihabitans telluris]UQX89314.1 YihY/virulence factor BrkB family protein [Jatrophihabitans telluris]